MQDLILVLDEGTTSTRAMVFDSQGALIASAQEPLEQYYPQPGWVEHDALEIWDKTIRCARQAIKKSGREHDIAAIGITNQRETVVAWDKASGEPLARAIVWQDRRTADFCEALRAEGLEESIQRRTGLLLDPYFSASKMRWLLENDEQVAAARARGSLCVGTIESWLAFKLTGGAHLTDASNASRTMLMTLDGAGFDEELCEIFGVPRAALGEIVDTSGQIGMAQGEWFGREIPICAMVGDQQSATIGQACLEKGETKATYGTGAFVLTNMGEQIPRSRHRLLGTVLSQTGGERRYALEGSVFVAGSLIQWLRDSLGIVDMAAQTEELARSIVDSGGVVIVPALAGLGAPHWRAEARCVIAGMSFATGKAELARAALEAMAHQTHDLAEAFAADGAKWERLKIDGGMSANDWMAQDLANMLGLVVERPEFVETTALGAAMLAARGVGLYRSLDEAARAMRGPVEIFTPNIDPQTRDRRLAAWRKALSAA